MLSRPQRFSHQELMRAFKHQLHVNYDQLSRNAIVSEINTQRHVWPLDGRGPMHQASDSRSGDAQ